MCWFLIVSIPDFVWRSSTTIERAFLFGEDGPKDDDLVGGCGWEDDGRSDNGRDAGGLIIDGRVDDGCASKIEDGPQDDDLVGGCCWDDDGRGDNGRDAGGLIVDCRVDDGCASKTEWCTVYELEVTVSALHASTVQTKFIHHTISGTKHWKQCNKQNKMQKFCDNIM